MSRIEWTEETWNPVTGCSPVSEGCRNCYAAREAIRLAGHPNPKVAGPYQGASEVRGTGKARRPVFTGKVNVLHERLGQPLRWRKPRRVFVNSMSDLFHDEVHRDFILRVWAVMARTPQHTYQILTKRPHRMALLLREWMQPALSVAMVDHTWPLPNVWLGTSVEDQSAADERIPHLLECPAAVRFLSCEPLLGPVDVAVSKRRERDMLWYDLPLEGKRAHGQGYGPGPRIHWIIAGGESGPRARPCDVAWIRSLVTQCRDAGVACFVKQLGAVPLMPCGCKGRMGHACHQCNHPRGIGDGRRFLDLRDRKGGDPAEWPADLRVREWPEGVGRD